MSLHLVGYSEATFGDTQKSFLVAWVGTTLSLSSAATVAVLTVIDDYAAGRHLLSAGACYVLLAMLAKAGTSDSLLVQGAEVALTADLAPGSSAFAVLQATLPALTSASVSFAPPAPLPPPLPPRSPPSPPLYPPLNAVAAAPASSGGKSLVLSLIAPVVASVGGALGSFVAYKFLAIYRKTPQGKKLDQALEALTKCVTCQSGAGVHTCPVFISFRVNEASREAAALQAALRRLGVRAYVCNAGETKLAVGELWEDSITNALATCTTFVVMGSRTYGAEGRETVDTKKELRYATVAKKDIVVIKMTDAYTEPYAQARARCAAPPRRRLAIAAGGVGFNLARPTRARAVAERCRHLYAPLPVRARRCSWTRGSRCGGSRGRLCPSRSQSTSPGECSGTRRCGRRRRGASPHRLARRAAVQSAAQR